MNRYSEVEAKVGLILMRNERGTMFHAWVDATKECGLPHLIFAPTALNPKKMRGLDGLVELIEDEIGVAGDWSHKFTLAYVRLCFANDTDQMLVKLALNGCYDNLQDWLNRP